ncbi:dihydrodipicolinate synthase family protein [Nonomuraea polychroma]|uniref:dihydrodipicolinate synthase family protein n=1 Tax=Nonomuraea polychroma TaxID=46176 RepID=UPI0013E32418|nr:dihydrodipicolinate synthase family protein [Nonomuraea polychroma]
MIRGVSPVLPTPFRADGSIDRRSFERVITHTWELGVGSVMFPGFASEYFALSDLERLWLLSDLAETVPPGRLLVASVAEHATHLAVRQVRRYADLGAGAINVLPPHFCGPPRAMILDHLAAVLQGAGPLPVVVQLAPRDTGTRLDPGDLARLRADHPNLAAVKVECRSPGSYIRALTRHGVPCLAGNAGIDLPEALEAGAVGIQPGGGFVDLYLRILRLWDTGERAAALDLHARLAAWLESWWPVPGAPLAMGKAIAWRRGIIDEPHCRAPGPTIPSGSVDPALAEVDRFIREFSLGRHAPE